MYIHNNKLTPRPTIGWYNRAFRYGDAFFETMLYRQGSVKLLPLHYKRLTRTLELLQMEPPANFSYERSEAEIKELAQHLQLDTAKVRITLWRNGEGTYTPQENTTSYIIEAAAIDPQYLTLNEKGLVLDVYRDTWKNTDFLANLKTIGCLIYTLASLFVKKQGVDDALLLNHRGRVAECTSSNIFMVKDNTITTPPLTEGCLDGVQRAYLLQTLPQKGFEVKEQPITLQDLTTADEVFTTNALGIKWVQEIKGVERTFGDKYIRQVCSIV